MVKNVLFFNISGTKMGRGIIFALSAFSLFGFVYYFPVLLRPLSLMEMFCWRLLMSFPAIVVLITLQGKWQAIIALLGRIKKNPYLIFAFLFSSSMLAIQMLIFIWAPLNGKALATSLGYFILPLAMVVAGRFVYKEKFTSYQKVAIGLAVIGVIHELWVAQAFSWETIVVLTGYPIYLIFRRKMNMEGIEGTFMDFLLIAIGCGIYMYWYYGIAGFWRGFGLHPVAIPVLGIITAIAFAFYFSAVELLPLGLFGLLSYFEPVLLTIVSIFFLGEKLAPEHVLTYVMIWAAVAVLATEVSISTIQVLVRRKHHYVSR